VSNKFASRKVSEKGSAELVQISKGPAIPARLMHTALAGTDYFFEKLPGVHSVVKYVNCIVFNT
jgi:hypothetical protein